MKMKYCPLQVAAYIFSGKELSNLSFDCTREKCGWWDEVEGGRCAILSLVGSLDDIATKLMHIEQELTGLKEVIGRG